MENRICMLSSCGARKGKDSMGIQAATDETACRMLLEGFAEGTACREPLEYGSAENREDAGTAEPLRSTDRFQGAADIRMETAESAIGRLGLDRRRLVWSVAEIKAGNARGSFMIPGFCDLCRLEENEGFRKMMDSADEKQATAGLFTYAAGTGETVRPDSAELEIIRRHEDEMEWLSCTEQIQSDFFGFCWNGEDAG